MKSITLTEFSRIVKGNIINNDLANKSFSSITVDSRKTPQGTLFFALEGNNVDGHQYISDAISNGAVAAVISKNKIDNFDIDIDKTIIVNDPLVALQCFAGWWRKQLLGKVIAITGSNGKTITKDALIKILSKEYTCSGTPYSFNSFIGVPLSVVRVPFDIDYAVFEAGISVKNEASVLEPIISPDYGIITNIGLAHLSSFGNRDTIAHEKSKLFLNMPSDSWLLIPEAEPLLDRLILNKRFKVYRFGKQSEEIPYIKNKRYDKTKTILNIFYPSYGNFDVVLETPSTEIATDLEIAICASYLLGASADSVIDALSNYAPSHTRMEIWESPEGYTFINDSYSSDPISVKSALNSLKVFKKASKKIFVFGGMKELGRLENSEHAQIGMLAADSQVDDMILVGDKKLLSPTELSFKNKAPNKAIHWCSNSNEIKNILLPILDFGDVVLFKGPRNTDIDKVVLEMVDAISPNRFIVDLQAIQENILRFKKLVGSSTRTLAMVKALAYGSDSKRLSLELQEMGIDYLGVANVDEGCALRREGVTLPILVMMHIPEESHKLVHNDLTPVIYSPELVAPLSLAAHNQNKNTDVHIEIDTGMGRLGVMPNQVIKLIKEISKQPNLHLKGVMTHFAAAEDPTMDKYTREQIHKFNLAVDSIKEYGFKDIICHTSATAGTLRFPEARYDMVRIGLGMYGIYPSIDMCEIYNLDLAISLVSRIVDIKIFPKDYKIGYGRTYTTPFDNFRAGFVPLGYNDGVPLNLSNEIGKVMVNGAYAPIIGRVSMDSLIIDLSHLPEIKVNTDVLIYGKQKGNIIRPEHVAQSSKSIPYELLTRLSSRVQRIFIKKAI